MAVEPDLTVQMNGLSLENPTVLASGILGTTCGIMSAAAQNGAGAVTIKSISVAPRKGHPNPTVLSFGGGMINAVGYSNPGIEEAIKEFSHVNEVGCPVIGSLIGIELEDFSRIASEFDKLDFAALEVPLSCPHTPGYGKMGAQDTPEAASKIVKTICAETSKPLFVKLPPASNNLVEMAQAAKEAGAFGITAVNTIGPGMFINADFRKPVLGFGIGGISGPPLKPLALATVFQLYANVDMPIIGTGGVSCGRDAIEMIMAGATAVGLGTSVYTEGISTFKKITDEMKAFMKERGIGNLSEIRGAAHAS